MLNGKGGSEIKRYSVKKCKSAGDWSVTNVDTDNEKTLNLKIAKSDIKTNCIKACLCSIIVIVVVLQLTVEIENNMCLTR